MLIDGLKIGTRLLDQRFEHDIHVSDDNGTTTFCLTYGLLCLAGHAFVLALLESLA